GPQADSTRNLVGDYAYICHIESLMEARKKGQGDLNMPVPDAMEVDSAFVPMQSILEVLRSTASGQTELLYAKGCEVLGEDRSGFAAAVDAAKQADVALVFLGGKSGLTDDCTCGEARDRADLNLTGVQQALLEAIHATGTPTVLVLINGRPLSIGWAAENVPAIVEAWLPGEEGAGAVTDVLFGDVNPGGKLPISVPRHVGQIPTYYNHKPSGGRSHWKVDYVDFSHTPLWPFGHGLSYTQFKLDNLRLDKSTVQAGESVSIQVDLSNIGPRQGSEVVQLYVCDEVATVTRPIKELKGFVRVDLQPGEQRTVTFELSIDQLAFYDRNMRFVLEPGTIKLMIGTSSVDLPLQAEVAITGETVEVGEKVFFSRVSVG
ncbi:MAG: glycoside hydrolase family 3 C-terminal domain-containing protein, partial [Caldilineaceae bacterium]